MYKNGEAALDRILELVAKCPKELQEKCFEVLLSGYVKLEVGNVKPHASAAPTLHGQPTQPPTPPADSNIPALFLNRFKNTAKRLGITLERLESLFDFSVDPFVLHAVEIPGKKNAEKSRQVVLLAAARSYLATGSWSADWQEVKALCVDHNCYDSVNHAKNLKQGTKTLFKVVDPRKPIEVSTSGVKEAESLLKILAGEIVA
jgi:hypothetical protein